MLCTVVPNALTKCEWRDSSLDFGRGPGIVRGWHKLCSEFENIGAIIEADGIPLL